MIPATGGWTTWKVYTVQEDLRSDYCIDNNLLKEWEELKEKLEEIQSRLVTSIKLRSQDASG